MSSDVPPPENWPQAELDRIAHLRVLAAGLPGVVVEETVLDVPFPLAWHHLTDFERSVPFFDEDVRRLHIVQRSGDPERGERFRFASRQTGRALWIPARIDVTLSPGWCWMVSRPQAYVVGMAAEPDGERTRLAHLEGLAIAGPGWLRALARPILAVSRWRHRRHVPKDLAGMHNFIQKELRGGSDAV